MDLYFLREAADDWKHTEVVRTGFGYAQAEKGSTDYFEHTASTIAMLLEGEVEITGDLIGTTIATAGNIGCFPTGVYHNISIREDTKALFLYIIGDNQTFCEGVLTPETLADMPLIDTKFHTLPITPMVRLFADQVKNYILDRTRLANDISWEKQTELRALLASCYSQKELAQMLAPLFRINDPFYTKVMELTPRFATIEEMAESLNMSRSTFIRRFHHTFNESPRE